MKDSFPEGVLDNTTNISPLTYLDSIMNGRCPHESQVSCADIVKVPLFNISEDNAFLQ